MFGLTGWKKSHVDFLFPIYCLVTMPVFASNLCPKTDVKSKKKYAILFIYDTVKMSQPNTKFSQVSTLFGELGRCREAKKFCHGCHN